MGYRCWQMAACSMQPTSSGAPGSIPILMDRSTHLLRERASGRAWCRHRRAGPLLRRPPLPLCGIIDDDPWRRQGRQARGRGHRLPALTGRPCCPALHGTVVNRPSCAVSHRFGGHTPKLGDPPTESVLRRSARVLNTFGGRGRGSYGVGPTAGLVGTRTST